MGPSLHRSLKQAATRAGGSLHRRVIGILGLKDIWELVTEGLCKREEGDPVEDHCQGVTLGDAFLDQDNLWFASWLPANEMNLMVITVEQACGQAWAPVPHRP